MKNQIITISLLALILQSCSPAGSGVESASSIAPKTPTLPIGSAPPVPLNPVSWGQFNSVPVRQAFTNPFCLYDLKSSKYFRESFKRTASFEITIERSIYTAADCTGLYGITRRSYQFISSEKLIVPADTDIMTIKSFSQTLRVFNQATADSLNQGCMVGLGYEICDWNISTFRTITNTSSDYTDPAGPVMISGIVGSVEFYFENNIVGFDNSVFQ